jgi:hypothetical protein
MSNLRKTIRKIILESEGIQSYEVNSASAVDGDKRYKGHMAKKIFADKADRDFLNSITYITTVSVEKIDSWIAKSNSRDELSCLAIGGGIEPDGSLLLPYGMSPMFNNRIALVIDGWVTWLRNKNAATGHSGRILKRDHKGIRPASGVNKAPGKMFGKFYSHELEGVIMDEEDLEDYDLYDFWDRPNKNNEALVDNWTVTGIVIPAEDLSGDVEMDFDIQNKISLEAYEKIKQKWPKAKLFKGTFD